MSLKSFLGRLRKQSPDLPSLKVIGGPVSIQERVQVPFMPDQSTTPRNIELRKNEEGTVFAVVWYVGKQCFSEIFKEELQAKAFYDIKMQKLHEAAQQEAAQIKENLEREFAESWKDAQKCYFHKGFKVRVLFSESEKAAKINRRLLGLIEGECPFCGTVQVFDSKENFLSFLKSLDDVLDSDERLMPSHGGFFSEVGLAVRNRCSNCLSYPNVFFTAQANKGLLRKLTLKGGEIGE